MRSDAAQISHGAIFDAVSDSDRRVYARLCPSDAHRRHSTRLAIQLPLSLANALESTCVQISPGNEAGSGVTHFPTPSIVQPVAIPSIANHPRG